jgi:hypothetical protein
MRFCAITRAVAMLSVCWPTTPLMAQYAGHNMKGDIGLKSATQPGPGLYLSGLFYRYDVDRIRDQNGRTFGQGHLVLMRAHWSRGSSRNRRFLARHTAL